MASGTGLPRRHKFFWMASTIFMPVWFGAFFLTMWRADRAGRTPGPMHLFELVILVGALFVLLVIIAGIWVLRRYPASSLVQPARGIRLAIAAIYYVVIVGLETFIYLRRLIPPTTDPAFIVWQYSTTVSALGGAVVAPALADLIERVRPSRPTADFRPPSEASVT